MSELTAMSSNLRVLQHKVFFTEGELLVTKRSGS